MKTLHPALTALLQSQQVWRGPAATFDTPLARCGTGFRTLDAALPLQGWPASGLVEVLNAAEGLGELSLVLPTLATLSAQQKPILVIAPPYRPYAPAWHRAGVQLAYLHVIETTAHNALWAMEQALRAGCCGAVLAWPAQADDKALRRLQIAADSGQTLGFVFRTLEAARNPSPAPLRVSLESTPAGTVLRILKCRGRNPPAGSIPFRAVLPH